MEISNLKITNNEDENSNNNETMLKTRKYFGRLPFLTEDPEITVSAAEYIADNTMINGIPAWRLKALEVYICICTLINGQYFYLAFQNFQKTTPQ